MTNGKDCAILGSAPPNIQSIRWFCSCTNCLRYLKGYEKQALLAPLFKMLEACFELFVPLVVASIIDTGIKDHDTVFIWQRCGLLVLLAVIGLTCSLTAQFFFGPGGLGVRHCAAQGPFPSHRHPELQRTGRHRHSHPGHPG